MTEHKLKTWPEYFEQVSAGAKRFEIRDESDRTFKVGDTLVLQEYDSSFEKREYTGRSCKVVVTSVLRGIGLKEGYCAMSIMPIGLPIQEYMKPMNAAQVLMDETLKVLP